MRAPVAIVSCMAQMLLYANLRGGVRENMCLSLLWGKLFTPSHFPLSICAQSVVVGTHICRSKPPASCAAC